MRMEPGWFPYRRKPGKPLASAVRPGNLKQNLTWDISSDHGQPEPQS